jgi:hypothetical protein
MENIAEPVQIEEKVGDGVFNIFVSSLPAYAPAVRSHVAENIAEPVQIEERVGDGVSNIFVSSLSTYAVHQAQVEKSWDGVLTIFASSLPTYASVAGCHVAEDIAEPVQIEDRVGNGILVKGDSQRCRHNCLQRLHLQLANFAHSILHLNIRHLKKMNREINAAVLDLLDADLRDSESQNKKKKYCKLKNKGYIGFVRLSGPLPFKTSYLATTGKYINIIWGIRSRRTDGANHEFHIFFKIKNKVI